MVRVPGKRSRVLCLLPVRDGEAHLGPWFAAVEPVADAVIALDDGSTDTTLQILAQHPLVERLITNAPRAGFLGWDDGANRARLLEAAAEADAGWILFLDADERIDPTDAAALRSFIDADALPGCAYGFQLFSMVDASTFDPAYEWVYRLFAFRPGLLLPDPRLDFNPVPVTIPDAAWLNTSLRIQHLGAHSDAERAAMVEKYREADPAGEFRSYYEHLPSASPPPYPIWRPRPVGAAVEISRRERPSRAVPASPSTPSAASPAAAGPSSDGVEAIAASADVAPGSPIGRPLDAVSAPRPRVVCLLPARNCEAELAGWFEAVAPLVDAVVALDDGSTDGTATVLRTHPTVKIVLQNPRRETYEGWDDAANRNRLLIAAAALEPEWIISLDADERIPFDDAVALRRFIIEEARPGFAYGFPRYRMIDDLRHYDHIEYVAWRLFAWSAGQRFSHERLHLTPVPTTLSEERRIETTVRIQHLCGLTEEHRAARWQKFAEADPDREWEADYEYVRQPPGLRAAWPPRKSGLAVIVVPQDPQRRDAWEAEHLDLEGPVATIAVIFEAGQDPSRASIAALLMNSFTVPTEILLVGAASATAQEEPQAQETVAGAPVRFIPLGSTGDRITRAMLGNAALRAARGDYVLILCPGETIDDEALAQVVDAHELGYAVVTGEVRHAGSTAVGWAAHFLDHAVSLPAGIVGQVEFAPAAGSWRKEVALRLGGFPEGLEGDGAGALGEALSILGHRTWRGPITLDRKTDHRGWVALFADQNRRGRTLARLLEQQRVDRSASSPPPEKTRPEDSWRWSLTYGPRRLAAIRRHVAHADPAVADEFRRVAPMVAVGVLGAWSGLIRERMATAVVLGLARGVTALNGPRVGPSGSRRGGLRVAAQPAIARLTYVVIAVKDRHEMTTALLDQLEGGDGVFVFDNGSVSPFPGAEITPEASLYEMWNMGLDRAREMAGGRPFDVAFLNNDLEVPPGFLGRLAAGLRQHDDQWLAYPNWENLAINAGAVESVRVRDGRHISGWVFMLRGDVGMRFDEQFRWWYGDNDIQFQVERQGRKVVCVGGLNCVHLEPGRSTDASPALLALAAEDEVKFARKWGG